MHTTKHRKLFHCVREYKLLTCKRVSIRFQILAALKLYTAIAVYIYIYIYIYVYMYICIVITEKRYRNNDAHNTTTASSIKAFSCRFHTSTLCVQCVMKNAMPSWLELGFSYWIPVVDVHCRIVEKITMKCRTV